MQEQILVANNTMSAEEQRRRQEVLYETELEKQQTEAVVIQSDNILSLTADDSEDLVAPLVDRAQTAVQKSLGERPTQPAQRATTTPHLRVGRHCPDPAGAVGGSFDNQVPY